MIHVMGRGLFCHLSRRGTPCVWLLLSTQTTIAEVVGKVMYLNNLSPSVQYNCSCQVRVEERSWHQQCCVGLLFFILLHSTSCATVGSVGHVWLTTLLVYSTTYSL